MKLLLPVFAVALSSSLALAETDATDAALEADLALHTFSDVCESGLHSYEQTTYQLLRTNCAGCHDGRLAAAPAFATEDVEASYFQILNHVDFNAPLNSRLSFRGGNGHCGCSMTAQRVADSIQAWWDGGENMCERSGRFFSQEMAVPTDLPSRAQGFSPVRFDLSNLGVQFRGMQIELEAQKFSEPTPSSPGSYRFRKPRIVGMDRDVTVQNVRVLVNHKFDVMGSAYTSIDGIFSAEHGSAGLVYPVMSSKLLTVIQDQPQGDMLSVSFEGFDYGVPDGCTQMPMFSEKVLPSFSARNCYACHGGGPDNAAGFAPANAFFPMNEEPARLCQSVDQRIDRADVTMSPLIAYPLRMQHGHPRIFVNSDEMDLAWRDWLNAEIGL
jgi:mono/diheme cytochrome c family protein